MSKELLASKQQFYTLLDEYRRALLSDIPAPHVQKQQRVDKARLAIIEAYEQRNVVETTQTLPCGCALVNGALFVCQTHADGKPYLPAQQMKTSPEAKR